MKSTLITLLTVILLVAGCAHSSHMLTGTARPATVPAAVKIYSTMPPGAVVIAILNSADAWVQSSDRALNAMKRDAAGLGANGIFIQQSKVSGWTGAQITGTAIFVP